MIEVVIESPDDFDAWRAKARGLLRIGAHPADVHWRMAQDAPSLFSGGAAIAHRPAAASLPAIHNAVPKIFLALAQIAMLHRDEQRFARLYSILWRLQSERGLLSRRNDDDIGWLHDRAKSVRRDIHKMHAFVRFKKIGENQDGREAFAAWYEPDHYITRHTAGFFRKRFYGMDWAIITPHARAIWQDEILCFGPGGERSEVPIHDVIDDQWRTYYGAIFNPARIKIKAMQSEMPKKYWKNLPEADQILPLLIEAPDRVKAMHEKAVQAANPKAEKWQAMLER
ncbi:TIGR03915 family putative DNA repair protein [Sphingorhabdus arenilitoris]|uniref:TIGR03915 family putative DNA repair protein n=1 Tax=Sphingorhabdus arenilitoris TaxID=1490041 RepID=A0ABV8RDE0_9SPHN